ncbi:MAG: hypothetical protein IPO41_12970 [Acidobacteria bacterium]|nr:hypothetical protein [Acidobacteriota bacterium]
MLIDGTGLASNYLLTGGAAVSTTAAISPRPLTIDGVLAADKVYDGNRDATVSGGSLANLVAGQTLGLSLGAASSTPPMPAPTRPSAARPPCPAARGWRRTTSSPVAQRSAPRPTSRRVR